MSKNALIPYDVLLQVKNELYARIPQLTPSVAIDAGDVGEALAWSLLFEHWLDMLPGLPIKREDAFYNRYFWLKRFAILKQKRDRYDAGLEQQVFQLLDEPDFDLDWKLIEQLDAEASNT